MTDWHEYIKIFTALIAIVNPIGAIPVFVSLTSHLSERDKKSTVRTAAMSVFFVLIVVMFIGEGLLKFFGISIDSFRVGGGILLLLMAIAMMNAKQPKTKQTDEESKIAEEKETIGVVPLAIPLLSGPGAISSVILYAEKSKSIIDNAALGIVIFIVALIVWLVLRAAPKISKAIGRIGINIFVRIMGLIMTAIGVEFIAHGLMGLFPGLK